MVAGEDSTGTKLPRCLSFLKNSRPGRTSSKEPPLASAAAKSAENAEEDSAGLPLSATLLRYSGRSSSARVLGHFLTALASQPMEM